MHSIPEVEIKWWAARSAQDSSCLQCTLSTYHPWYFLWKWNRESNRNWMGATPYGDRWHGNPNCKTGCLGG